MRGPALAAGERRDVLLLAGLGAALEFVYAVLLVAPANLPHNLQRGRIDLVDLFGNGVPGMVAYAGPMVAAFALYGLAFGIVRRMPPARATPVIFGWGAVHAATLLFMFPGGAMDVFDYAANARTLWVYHQNPLLVAPLAHQRDPFSWYVVWPDLPSPYGPFWSLLAAVPAALTHGDVLRTVLAFKATAAAFFLAAGALVDVGLRDRPAARTGGVLLLLWNPLLLFEVAGNGHNDVVMAFFVVLALVLEQRGLHLPALLALTASALFKFVSLLLLPPFVLYVALNHGREGRRELALALPLAAALVVFAYYPFWGGVDTLDALRRHAAMVANSPAAVLAGLLQHSMGAGDARFVAKWLLALVFGAAYIILLLRPVRSFAGLTMVFADVLFLYLLLAAFWFQAWYLLWLLPLVPLLADWRRALAGAAFTLTAALMYVPVDFVWQRYFMDAGPLWPHRLAVLTAFPVPAALWLWAVGARLPVHRASPRPAPAAAGPPTSG